MFIKKTDHMCSWFRPNLNLFPPGFLPPSQLPSWSKRIRNNLTIQVGPSISIETIKTSAAFSRDARWPWNDCLIPNHMTVCFLSTNLELHGIRHAGCLSLPTNPVTMWYLKLRGQQIWRPQKEHLLLLTMSYRCHLPLIFLKVSIHNWQSSAHMDSMVDHWLDTTSPLQDERYSQL